MSSSPFACRTCVAPSTSCCQQGHFCWLPAYDSLSLTSVPAHRPPSRRRTPGRAAVGSDPADGSAASSGRAPVPLHQRKKSSAQEKTQLRSHKSAADRAHRVRKHLAEAVAYRDRWATLLPRTRRTFFPEVVLPLAVPRIGREARFRNSSSSALLASAASVQRPRERLRGSRMARSKLAIAFRCDVLEAVACSCEVVRLFRVGVEGKTSFPLVWSARSKGD